MFPHMKPTKNQNKGQVAIFLIIGILLLLAAGVTMYLQGRSIEKGRFEPIIDEVPAEFRPLKEFVDACLEQTTIKGLTLIGLHGGYIGLSADAEKYTDRSLLK